MAELRVKGTGTLKLFESDNTSSVTIASPASLGADRTVTLPDADVTLVSGTMSTGLTAADITGQTALGAEPADTDEFVLSDAGVLKRVDYSYIKGGGKIGQVVSNLWSGAASASSTSTTYAEASSDLATAITPTATSSKILITCTGGFSYVPDGNRMTCNMYYKVTSGGTYAEVGDTSYLMGLSNDVNAGVQSSPHAYSFLHSPSSVSELYYSLYFRRQSGSDAVYVTTINTVNFGISLTLMEILA